MSLRHHSPDRSESGPYLSLWFAAIFRLAVFLSARR